MPKIWIILGLALPLLLAAGAAYFLTRSPTLETASVEPQASAGCDLSDNGELDRLSQVRVAPVHPERHSRIFGIGLADPLPKACETLLAAGFEIEDMTNALVSIADIGDPADERAARFTRILQLRGPIANPLDGTDAEATLILVASSPATYATVEYIGASITHGTSVTVETWTEQLTAHFGPPSEFRPGRSPSWILDGQEVTPGSPAALCDPAIADHAAPWWEAVPEIDVRAAFDDSLPAHDGRTCTIVVTAEAVSAEDDPTLVGRTRLAFIDYVSIAANRRAENAHVRSLRYPSD